MSTDDVSSGDQSSGDQSSADVSIEPWVRAILRCPACGSTLADGRRADGAPELVCTGEACALAYPVRDGVPVLLVDEAYPSGGTV